MTQVRPESLNLPFKDQQHGPLGLSSGAFRGSQLRWGTPEKEEYAVVHVVFTFDYILLRVPQFRIFTDHLNLKYIYNSHSVDSSLARRVVYKLQRWALKISVFNYVIDHIPGKDNCWADLPSQFGSGEGASNVPAEHVLGIVFQAPPQICASKYFKLPTVADFNKCQQECFRRGKESFSANAQGFLVNGSEKFWIPTAAEEMKRRVCVTAHCGRGGNRGCGATKQFISECVSWDTMDADIAAFCQHCLLCRISSGTNLPLVPYAPTLQCEEPNEAIHFDFLYCGPSKKGDAHVLILKNNFSSFVWLVICEAATVLVTAEALFGWFTSFGIVPIWISDRGYHFRNEVMGSLAETLHVHHRLTTYSVAPQQLSQQAPNK